MTFTECQMRFYKIFGRRIEMLKITKIVAETVNSFQGCGRWRDYDCGINARNG